MVDDTGKHYSKDPMPKERAREQQKALYASEKRGGRTATSAPPPPPPPPSYDRLKKTTGHYAPDIRPPQRFHTFSDTLREAGAEDLIPPPIEIPALREGFEEEGTPPRRRRRGRGMCGGGLVEDAQAQWDAMPPPKKLTNETEEAYQRRLLRVKQQNERFAQQGIAPQQRSGALSAQAKARQLEQLKDTLGQEAITAAWERDPNTIAKKAEIARKERENAIFGPILRGLTGIADVGTKLVSLPGISQAVDAMGPLGTALKGVSKVYQNFASDQLNQTFADEDARKAAREEKERMLQPYNEQIARQRADARGALGLAPDTDIQKVDFRDLQRQIEEQKKMATLPMYTGGASAMPRFGVSRFF